MIYFISPPRCRRRSGLLKVPRLVSVHVRFTSCYISYFGEREPA